MSLLLGGNKSQRGGKKEKKNKKRHLKASQSSSLIPAGGLGCAKTSSKALCTRVCVCDVCAQTLTNTSVAEQNPEKRNTGGLSAEHNTRRCGIIIGTPVGECGSEEGGAAGVRWHEAKRRPAAPKGQSRVGNVSPRRRPSEAPSTLPSSLKKSLDVPSLLPDSLAKVLGARERWGGRGRKGSGGGERGRAGRGRRKREGETRSREKKESFLSSAPRSEAKIIFSQPL